VANSQVEKGKMAIASFHGSVRLFTLKDTLLKQTSDHIKHQGGFCTLEDIQKKASQQTGNLAWTGDLIAVILRPNGIAEQEKR